MGRIDEKHSVKLVLLGLFVPPDIHRASGAKVWSQIFSGRFFGAVSGLDDNHSNDGHTRWRGGCLPESNNPRNGASEWK